MASKTPTTSLSKWNFQDQHVQQNLVGGDFVGSHSCIICATAPRLSDLTVAGLSADGNTTADSASANPGAWGQEFAIPIGVVDSASLAQDRQMAQIFEIGSKRSYLMSARTMTSFQIARVFYKGPSLLRMLYAYYPAAKIHPNGIASGNTLADLQNDTATAHSEEPIAISTALSKLLPVVQQVPGYDNFIINLDSDLFSQPMGLVLYYKDNLGRDVGAVFLEECYVANHNMGVSANSVLVAENTVIRCERVVPMKVNVVKSGGVIGDGLSSIKSGLTGAVTDAFGSLSGIFGGTAAANSPKL